SNIFGAQVPDAPIQAPTDLAATPRSFSTMRLTWVDRSSNEEAFIIERRQSEEDDYDEIGEAAPNNPQFLDEDLDRGTSYQYRVLAYRGGGQIVSDYSNVVTNSTFAELSAPTGLAAMPNGMSSIWLNWGDSVFQDGFQIERRIEGQGEFEEVSQTDQTTTVDTGLEQETTYEYRVLAFVNYQGDLVVSDYSGVATATTLGEIAFFDDYEEYEVGAPPDREAYNIDAQGESTVLVTEEAAYESNQGLEFDDLPNDGDYVMCFVEHGPVSLGSFSCWLNLAPEGYFGLIGANAADIITWQVQFGNDNTYLVRNGANLEVGGDAYPVGEWIEFRLDYDVPAQTYSIFFNGEPVNEGLQLQQPDQINTQILAIVYNGPDTGIDYVYIDDFEVRRTEPEERGLWVRDSGPGNNQSAVSIQDYLRIGPVR
ncbi:MAG: fibronectin type III domain-containing protein, partial [Calditrichaeota bacterium]|nr:fibronectin type III domain-containing protein [Calditrichota bacterium]